MQITRLTMTLLVLFFPGIVCTMLYDALTVHKERKGGGFFILAFVFGMLCYSVLLALKILLLGLSVGCLPITIELSFTSALSSARPRVDFLETTAATLLALPVALALSYAHTHKWLHKAARRFRISYKFGELGVWELAFASTMPEWILVQDFGNDRAYSGWVRAFSDTVDDNELLLRDVRVYRLSTGRELYRRGAIYLSRPSRDVITEFTAVPYKEWSEQEVQEDGRE